MLIQSHTLSSAHAYNLQLGKCASRVDSVSIVVWRFSRVALVLYPGLSWRDSDRFFEAVRQIALLASTVSLMRLIFPRTLSLNQPLTYRRWQ